jgi:hypothetical protein
MAKNKGIDCFREISLKEILEHFNNDHIFIEIDHNEDRLYSPCHDIEYHDSELGLFWGELCELTMSPDDKVKILDHDTVKIIKSKNEYNLGKILRFFVCKPHSFI